MHGYQFGDISFSGQNCLFNIFSFTPANMLLLLSSLFCERFEPRSHFKSRLSLIVPVNVVLNRTVVVDSD